MSNYNALYSSLKGVFKDYMNTEAPASLKVAPIVYQNSSTGQYLTFTNPGFAKEARPAVKNGGPGGGFLPMSDAGTTFNTVETLWRSGERQYLSDIERAAVESLSDVSLQEHLIRFVSQPIFADHVSDTIASIAALPGTASLTLTSETAPVLDTFRAEIRAIQKATGRRPTHVYMGAEAYDAFLNQDEVQKGVALAGYTISGGTSRRTDGPDMGYLETWFKSKLGLELVTESFVWTNTSDVQEFMVSTTCGLLTVGAGMAPSTLKTACRTIGRSGDLVDFYVEKAGIANNVAPGIFVAASGDFKLWTPESVSGRKISLTI
jgi:hypothetical protein